MKESRTDHEPQTVAKCVRMAPKLARALRAVEDAVPVSADALHDTTWARAIRPIESPLLLALRNARAVLSEWDLID